MIRTFSPRILRRRLRNNADGARAEPRTGADARGCVRQSLSDGSRHQMRTCPGRTAAPPAKRGLNSHVAEPDSSFSDKTTCLPGLGAAA
jgi:hypothetical protein